MWHVMETIPEQQLCTTQEVQEDTLTIGHHTEDQAELLMAFKLGHTVTVTDSNGCQAVETFVITQPSMNTNNIIFKAVSQSRFAAAIGVTQTSTAAKCNGQASGSATVTASGGSGRFIYSWNPFVSNGATAPNITGGIYEVTVTDSRFCSASIFVVVDQSDIIFQKIRGFLLFKIIISTNLDCSIPNQCGLLWRCNWKCYSNCYWFVFHSLC